MITRVEIQNYGCLREVSLSLAPLTALVGPNGAGKSTLLAALNAHCKLAQKVWRNDRRLTVTVRLQKEGARPWHKTWRQAGGKAEGDAHAYQLLHLDLQAARSQNKVEYQGRLAGNGANLANVLASLSRREREDFAKQLCELIPLFADVDVRPVASGTHHVVFQDRWEPSLWYTPDQVSDGTMLVLAYLLLPRQPERPDIVAIEEPERSLHPYLIGQVVGLLRKLAHGELGPAVQVVLATHSPTLLDHLRPEEVRFLSRSSADGAVTVEEAPVGTPEWEEAFAAYRASLADAWLSGGLGGVPGR